MIEYLGWAGTALVVIGYIFNSYQSRMIAFISWILGDIFWIVYDVYIDNPSHLVLSAFIIIINLFGIKNSYNGTKRISRTSEANERPNA